MPNEAGEQTVDDLDVEVDETDETDETRDDENTEQAPEIKAALERAVTAERRAQDLAALVGDPDVAALLKAKEDGQSITLRLGGERESEEEADMPELPADVDLDAMTPARLVRTLMTQLPAMVRSAVGESTAPVLEQLGGLQAERSQERQTKLAGEVKALVERYPDFPEYRDQIKKLCTENKLSLQDAYFVARLRSGRGAPTAVTSTERPSTITIRRPKKESPARHGSRGFADDLDDIMDRMVLPRGMGEE